MPLKLFETESFCVITAYPLSESLFRLRKVLLKCLDISSSFTEAALVGLIM